MGGWQSALRGDEGNQNLIEEPPAPPQPILQLPPEQMDQARSGGTWNNNARPTRMDQLRHAALRLDVQPTHVVKNPVHLKKKTLQLEKDPEAVNLYYLSFEFDASVDVEIEVHVVATETVDEETQIPSFYSDVVHRRQFLSGMHQNYRSEQDEAINLASHGLQDLQYSEGSSTYPLVVVLRAISKEAESVVQCQFTFGTLVMGTGGSGWSMRCLKQKVQYGQKVFEVQEIYGLERLGAPNSGNVEDQLTRGRECVICLWEERDVAVFPCRHMCLCKTCANVIRLQGNRCPICRQPATSLIQIVDGTSNEVPPPVPQPPDT